MYKLIKFRVSVNNNMMSAHGTRLHWELEIRKKIGGPGIAASPSFKLVAVLSSP